MTLSLFQDELADISAMLGDLADKDYELLKPCAREIHTIVSPFYSALAKQSWYAAHVRKLQEALDKLNEGDSDHQDKRSRRVDADDAYDDANVDADDCN